MNRLQSYSRSIKEVFEGTLTVRHVASPLASFDGERSALQVRDWLNRKDFDQIGVRREGVVVGFARRVELGEGSLDEYCQPFADGMWYPASYRCSTRYSLSLNAARST